MNILFAALICLFSPVVWANDFSPKEIQNELDGYLNQQSLPLNTLYPKKDSRGNLIIKPDAIFSDSEIVTKAYINRKIELRNSSSYKASVFSLPSEPARNDDPRALIEDDPYTESILEMEERGLLKGQVTDKPWSDDYWPHYKGGPATRYNDPKFPSSSDWKENYDYVTKNPFHFIFDSYEPKAIDNLSPAEKYDLLIDKDSGALTRSLWEEGEQYYKAYGKVESWMGICHGWAPASYMTKRPKHAVQVLAFDGKTRIKFYPDDIKALQSLLWANSRFPTRFAGGRCDDKDPKVDENGRPTNSNCRDNNPSTWHNTIVNRVGLHKRSLVLDATYDYQVWNQPVIRYSYTYFNPQTMKTAPLDKAKVTITDFPNDKFAKYRATGTHFLIGVAMQVTYGIERRPTHEEVDGPENDSQNTVLYTYDLELDQNGNILGGEWYRLPHPDFLWTPAKNSQALAKNDYYILGQPNWSGRSALPEGWVSHAKEAAAQSQPLAKIINSLLDLSNNNH